MDKVWLFDENGEKIVVEEKDAKLYQRDIREGNLVIYRQNINLSKVCDRETILEIRQVFLL